jgi:alkaline phosphatase D
LLESVGAYWLKDDHDVHSDDAFPQRQKPIMGDFTFEQGLQIFRQQVPFDQPFRTVRWGRDLQIWLVEGRDFRSANSAPDGPDKSIWGPEQKEWLKRTMLASDATWKLLISPTPLVGPDRKSKADNHSNAVFAHEGNELRRWFAEHLGRRLFVVTGDRHWQYHSVDPQTGVNEFSIGAASAGNAGGTPGYDPEIHRFHLVQGGFLQIAVQPQGDNSQLTFELCDVKGKIAYRHEVQSAA